MKLSPREMQIAAHLQQGKTNKEIGRELALSQFTVRDDVRVLLARFNVKNRVAFAAAFASGKTLSEEGKEAWHASDRRAGRERRAVVRTVL